jgi:hypothetical protein
MSTTSGPTSMTGASVPQPRADSDGHPGSPAGPSTAPEIPGSDYRRSLVWRVYDRTAQTIDHKVGWDKLPLPGGLAVLIGVRNILRKKNLHDPSTVVPIVSGPTAPPRTPDHLVARSVDG